MTCQEKRKSKQECRREKWNLCNQNVPPSLCSPLKWAHISALSTFPIHKQWLQPLLLSSKNPKKVMTTKDQCRLLLSLQSLLLVGHRLVKIVWVFFSFTCTWGQPANQFSANMMKMGMVHTAPRQPMHRPGHRWALLLQSKKVHGNKAPVRNFQVYKMLVWKTSI